MTKRNKSTTEKKPTATNIDWPVVVPSEDGESEIHIGKARLRFGTLVVEFKDSAPANAIQNMIGRGVLMGFGVIMIQPDIVNEMYQDVVAEEEAQEKAIASAISAGILYLDDEGKPQSVNQNQTVDEVAMVFRNLDKLTLEHKNAESTNSDTEKN